MYLGVDSSPPDTIMMFKDCGAPDLNASTNDSPQACLKGLLSALENYTEADFVAALEQEEMEVDQAASTKG